MKNNLWKSSLPICVAAIFFLINCSHKTSVIKSQDFKERLASIKVISLESPTVCILLGASRNNATRQTEEEIEATEELDDHVKVELLKRGIQVVGDVESAQGDHLDGKMTISMNLFKRLGADNSTEFAGKLSIAIMTMGLITPPKNPSGDISIRAVLYDESNNNVIWSNNVADTSYCLVGQASFNLEKLVAELFDPLE